MAVRACIFIGALVLASGCQKKEEGASPVKATKPSVVSTSASTLTQADQQAAKSYDGPFGLAMGILPSELTSAFGFKTTSERPSQFSGTPPRPVPDFDMYFATATPGQGVCIVGAIQSVSVVNDSGDQLKQRVDAVAEMLTVKYGERTEKMDFATQDVYRRNSQFWMMALMKDAVTYAYSWKTSKKNKELPNNIDHIEVFASASSLDSGSVVIKYYFENEKKCAAEKRALKATNL